MSDSSGSEGEEEEGVKGLWSTSWWVNRFLGQGEGDAQVTNLEVDELDSQLDEAVARSISSNGGEPEPEPAPAPQSPARRGTPEKGGPKAVPLSPGALALQRGDIPIDMSASVAVITHQLDK
jgi:hypothetical protein